eukprot:2239421-Rhodomonas_salina.3
MPASAPRLAAPAGGCGWRQTAGARTGGRLCRYAPAGQPARACAGCRQRGPHTRRAAPSEAAGTLTRAAGSPCAAPSERPPAPPCRPPSPQAPGPPAQPRWGLAPARAIAGEHENSKKKGRARREKAEVHGDMVDLWKVGL